MSDDYLPFPKVPRLNREVLITEKIDGTNAQVFISDDGSVIRAGSRTRWIAPGKATDNYGFAGWVEDNRDELLRLGPGRHFGEWWGGGIQRGYGLDKGEKRFSLFNVARWADDTLRPACCHVVPLLWQGNFDTHVIGQTLDVLRDTGSQAAPGFLDPEGIIVYHTAIGAGFKVTLKNDEQPKGAVRHEARAA